jgi:hypothetical protein
MMNKIKDKRSMLNFHPPSSYVHLLKIILNQNITRQVLSHYAISFVISKLQSYGTAFLFKF